jgi:molybdopterin-guanine dinucleotide biosynthesis protein A
MSRIAAVILAGGKGERLGGVIKANVTVGGVRLLRRVARALGDEAHPVLVALGGFRAEELNLLPGQIAVPDLPTGYGGPLAGVAAAIDWCNRVDDPPELLITVAVDTPFLPPDFVARLTASLGPEDRAVVARYGEQDYPTNALWRLDAVTALPDRVWEGVAPHGLKRLAAAIGARSLHWPETASGDPFANVNTPADLALLEARAAGTNSP